MRVVLPPNWETTEISYVLCPNTGFLPKEELYLPLEEKLNGVITKYNLDTTGTPIAIVGGSNSGVNDDTIARYRSVWRSLFKFCLIVGDYESAVILNDVVRPKNPLPVKEETLLMYMEFMTGEEGQPLLHPTTKELVKDVKGRFIKIISRYHSPKSLEHLKSAISKLHSFFESTQGTVYFDGGCAQCLSNKARNSSFGCDLHRVSPNIRRQGNTVTSLQFKNHLKHWKKFAKQKYQQKGNLQLLPGEVRQIRQYLISRNTLTAFMIYVMFLAGIMLFLRVSEVLDMDVEHFELVHQVVFQNAIKAICVRVKGKSDPDWVYLMIYRDTENPEFCLLTHLLLWIELAGIRSGKVFPHPEDIGKSPTGHYSRACDYDWFLAQVKFLVFSVLGKKKEEVSLQYIVGTHILRKTAYLFAFFGCSFFQGNADNEMENDPIDKSQILLSARHSDEQCIRTYSQDSGTMFVLIQKTGTWHNHRVSKWQPIRILNHHSAASITTGCTPYQRSLPELANVFARHILKIHPRLPRTVRVHIDAALAYNPKSSAEEDLQALIARVVPPEHHSVLLGKIGALSQSLVRESQVSVPAQPVGPPLPAEDAILANNPSNDEPPPKRQRQLIDLEPHRSNFTKKNTSSQSQLDLLLQMEAEVGGECKKLESGSRRFYRRAMEITLCFRACCSGDKICFISKYPDHISHTKFVCFDGKQHKFSVSG